MASSDTAQTPRAGRRRGIIPSQRGGSVGGRAAKDTRKRQEPPRAASCPTHTPWEGPGGDFALSSHSLPRVAYTSVFEVSTNTHVSLGVQRVDESRNVVNTRTDCFFTLAIVGGLSRNWRAARAP